MPTTAMFAVVVDDTVQEVAAENQPTEVDFHFEVPTDYTAGPCLLQFMAHPSREPSDDFQVEFLINGQRVYRYGPSSAKIVRTFHVVFGRALMHGENILTVKRIKGTGTLGVSSAVVWWPQRTAPSAAKSATSKKSPKLTSRKPAKRPTKKSAKSTRRRSR